MIYELGPGGRATNPCTTDIELRSYLSALAYESPLFEFELIISSCSCHSSQ